MFAESCWQSRIKGEPPELAFTKVESPQRLSLFSRGEDGRGDVGAAAARAAREARRKVVENCMLEELVD
jgi:hypothetical protein